ncbi:abortive infection system antitoxin AbiGi family protein [Staphylococcus caprae]|uniref:abortive infection system antitoxin AbiGi family protein n=1 Tax=Staphylococcus caprae TaxID=29380 RepID=UPI001F563EBD|nr:abortive infection system antitoxin AbiGi family protein [Staphylococcus caprae]MCI2954772.1 abortive infection system antitoxin AbiGi family protein [Staphylococcus caprae]
MNNPLPEGESLKSEQHANCLIRCMHKIDYLINDISNMSMFPRFVQEDFRFLDVQFDGESIINLYIPMLCFCDIPIKNLKYHSKEYGNYAIAFNTDWGSKNRIAPVHYLYENSDVFEQMRTLFLYANDKEDYRIYNYLFNRLFFTKPKAGYQNGNQRLFIDEQEQRYVPIISTNSNGLKQFYLREDLNFRDLNLAIMKNDEFKLEFSTNDIKYIIVATAEEKKEVIQAIMDSKNIYELEKLDMITKIMSMNEIEEDF